MIDANGDEDADANERAMTLFAPQNIKSDIETMMNAVGGNRRSRIKQLVIGHMMSLLLLFSGFIIRSPSRRDRNHPRNLEMVTRMGSVHPWMSAKKSIEVIESVIGLSRSKNGACPVRNLVVSEDSFLTERRSMTVIRRSVGP